MKKLTILGMGCAVLLALASCNKKDEAPTAAETTEAPAAAAETTEAAAAAPEAHAADAPAPAAEEAKAS